LTDGQLAVDQGLAAKLERKFNDLVYLPVPELAEVISFMNNPKPLFEPLTAVPEEGSFRLRDTGFFSCLSSLGGFAGVAAIEDSLGTISQQGILANITDSSRGHFWMGTFFSPAPIKADQNSIPWLPNDYKDGFAFNLTYYLDRSVQCSEVYVNPVATEPYDLVSISWTPDSLGSTVPSSTYPDTGWLFTTGAGINNTQGVDNSSCVQITGASGSVYSLFLLPTYAITASSSVFQGRRAELVYSMKGIGDTYSGARLIWLDSSSREIAYKQKEDFASGFYNTYRLIDSIPSGATSGYLYLGTFTNNTKPATAFIDSPVLLIGENQYQCNRTISGPTTIPLPQIIKTKRISFVFSQRNPRREIYTKEIIPNDSVRIPRLNTEIETTLQRSIKNVYSNLVTPGTEASVFAYRVGLKELDVRYREHKPRGSLISLPLNTNKEIRQIWVTSEADLNNNSGTLFSIYPFANDPSQSFPIQPHIIGDTVSNTPQSVGHVMRIYSFEEYSSGFYNSNDPSKLIVPIQGVYETQEGTDYTGKLKLKQPIHFRKPTVQNITTWLDNYSIWQTTYDPNLATIYGLNNDATGTTLRTNIRNESVATISSSSFISRHGYQPIKVTIITDRWTAQPDIYGRPDVTKVRTVLGETLTRATATSTTTSTKTSYLPFNSWLTSITLRQLYAVDSNFPQYLDGSILETFGGGQHMNLSLKLIMDGIQQPYSKLQRLYDRLLGQGKIPTENSLTTVLGSIVDVNEVYSTKYPNLILGPNSSFLRLYWADAAHNNFIQIPSNSYTVTDPKGGVIRITQTAPATGLYVLADYNYLSDNPTEDHYGSVLGLTNTYSASASGASQNFTNYIKPYPLTRNMTDYINGKTPVLTIPNFNELTPGYYPIIEYYVNNDGEVLFARDFFKYGDIPGNIIIEYETLGISPRVGIQVIRAGSAAQSPSIYNVSLKVRENLTSFGRGVS